MSRITAIAASLIAVAAMTASSLAADGPIPNQGTLTGPVIQLTNTQTNSAAPTTAVTPDKSVTSNAALPGNRPETTDSATQPAMIQLKPEAPAHSMNQARTTASPTPSAPAQTADPNRIGTPQILGTVAKPTGLESPASAAMVPVPSQPQGSPAANPQDMISARVVPLLTNPPRPEAQQPDPATAGKAPVPSQVQSTGPAPQPTDQATSAALFKLTPTPQTGNSPVTNQPSTGPGGRCVTCAPKGTSATNTPKPLTRSVPPQPVPNPAPAQTSGPVLGQSPDQVKKAAPFASAPAPPNAKTPVTVLPKQADQQSRGPDAAAGPAKPIKSGSYFSIAPFAQPQTPKAAAPSAPPQPSRRAVPKQQRTTTSVKPQASRTTPPALQNPGVSRSTTTGQRPARTPQPMPQLHAPVGPQGTDIRGTAGSPPIATSPILPGTGAIASDPATGVTPQPARPAQFR